MLAAPWMLRPGSEESDRSVPTARSPAVRIPSQTAYGGKPAKLLILAGVPDGIRLPIANEPRVARSKADRTLWTLGQPMLPRVWHGGRTLERLHKG